MRKRSKNRKNRQSKKNRPKRLFLYRKQNGLCFYCNRQLSLDHKDINYITLDHIHPYSLGGESSIENYVGACHECNNKKGNNVLKNKNDENVIMIYDNSPAIYVNTNLPKQFYNLFSPVFQISPSITVEKTINDSTIQLIEVFINEQ